MSVKASTRTPQDHVSPPEPGLRRAAQSGLDVMLSDAVLDSGGVGRFVKPKTAGRTIGGLARHPRQTARDGGRFGVELARVAAGVGGNLAVTPGSVVLRTDAFELIQDRPSTKPVHAVPLLLVPPTINNYYTLDISPGRSMIEWLLGQQQQVFTISWRNPDSAQGHFDLDTYARAVLDARDAVSEITDQASVNVNAACSGGIITAGALGHLAAIGEQDKFATLTMMVCALDQAQMGTAGALASRELAAAAVAESARKGYIERSRACSPGYGPTICLELRRQQLPAGQGPARVRHPVLESGQRAVSGRPAPRLRLHGARQRADTPGEVEVLGTPIDLGAIETDSYTVAGLSDHIVPWENACRSTQLLGGSKRFVLSTSGHIQALVNPPTAASRASYRVVDDLTDDPEGWMTQPTSSGAAGGVSTANGSRSARAS